MNLGRFFALALVSTTMFSCRCDDVDSENDGGVVDAADEVDGDTPDGGPVDATVDGGSDLVEDAAGAGCGDDGIAMFALGDWTVAVDAYDGTWSASVADEVVLRGVAACEVPAFRRMEGAPQVQQAFGNFRIDLFGGEATWEDAVLGVPRAEVDGEELTLRWPNGSIGFALSQQGDLEVELDAGGSGGELALACAEDESFFGLGSQVTGMDLRGRTYPLWTQEQGNSKPEGGGVFPLHNIPEAAYAPMGIWHSTAGYSALVLHDQFSELDLCETSADRVALRSYGETPGFVALAGTPRDRMGKVADYVGPVRADLPDWAFGFWVDAVTGPERVSEVAETLRAWEIPASAIWTEDWIGGRTTSFGFRLSYEWSWDETKYPELPMLVDSLQARGFAFLGYFNPFIPQTTTLFAEAESNGYLVKKADGSDYIVQDPAFRQAGMVDLTNPAALEWLAGYQREAVVTVGLDGWMADFAEWLPTDAVMADGSTGWEFHNRYPLAWQAANTQNLAAAKMELGEPSSWIYFARSGWASAGGGSAGIAPALWGGDQNTTWEYDDGLPTVIPIGAHLGLSGVAMYGSDIGGYNSVGELPNTDKELWFRWASLGAFHPLMRTHHGGDKCNNWNFDRDAETLAHTKRWASVHSLLLPEFRRLLDEALASGLPISRHPWLVEPDRSTLWEGDQFQWFLGDDLLIAPVLAQGATERVVRLPGSGWWPLFGDTPASSDEETVAAPIADIPVYVRPGRALTLLGAVVDSFYGATDGAVTDLTDVAASYAVALYPDAMEEALTATDRPVSVGARGLAGWSTATVTLDGAPLEPCDGPPSSSCVDGETVVVVDSASGELAVGTATVAFEAEGPVTVRFGLGGAAWGELAESTSFTPNPDAPTWCPEEME